MKLLSEIVDLDTKILITEAKENQPKQYFIEGIFMQAEKKNRNGRVYPLKILERECAKYNEDYIKKNRAIGELNHPEHPQINPERASHKIISLEQNGSDFIGKAKIMDTPTGKVVKCLLDEGVNLGVSTRGLGTVKVNSKGLKEVNSDFMLTTIDIVSDPSAHDAWVSSIMESKEYYLENGIIREKQLDALVKDIKSLTKVQLSEGALLDMFDTFIRTLK